MAYDPAYQKKQRKAWVEDEKRRIAERRRFMEKDDVLTLEFLGKMRREGFKAVTITESAVTFTPGTREWVTVFTDICLDLNIAGTLKGAFMRPDLFTHPLVEGVYDLTGGQIRKVQ